MRRGEVLQVNFASPRPRGRGPIEAPVKYFSTPFLSTALHAREGVAPLKPKFSCWYHTSVFDSPRPRGRGPIEAVMLGCDLVGDLLVSPRPRGRGPIEAQQVHGCRWPGDANSPRPRGRGPIEATAGES